MRNETAAHIENLLTDRLVATLRLINADNDRAAQSIALDMEMAEAGLAHHEMQNPSLYRAATREWQNAQA